MSKTGAYPLQLFLRSDKFMNAVGIDVSKGKSMVAIMRPFGEIVSPPFEIKHTANDINSLVELINSVEGESRIVSVSLMIL